jgi:hypothetical protein
MADKTRHFDLHDALRNKSCHTAPSSIAQNATPRLRVDNDNGDISNCGKREIHISPSHEGLTELKISQPVKKNSIY